MNCFSSRRLPKFFRAPAALVLLSGLVHCDDPPTQRDASSDVRSDVTTDIAQDATVLVDVADDQRMVPADVVDSAMDTDSAHDAQEPQDAQAVDAIADVTDADSEGIACPEGGVQPVPVSDAGGDAAPPTTADCGANPHSMAGQPCPIVGSVCGSGGASGRCSCTPTTCSNGAGGTVPIWVCGA